MKLARNSTLQRKHAIYFANRSINIDPTSNTIACLTSYPKRIEHVHRVVESLLKQSHPVRQVILTLSSTEFPGGEKGLPTTLQNLLPVGLSILWTGENTRSYKKLLPVIEALPDLNIITFDDDILYEEWRVERLISATRTHPGCIIGHRGRYVEHGKKGYLNYAFWPAADLSTPPERVLLTGAGGILYPPHSLDRKLLLNYNLASQLAPTADDLWFWAVAKISGTKTICLGNNQLIEIDPTKEAESLNALNVDKGANDTQLRSLCAHFGL